MIFPGRGEAYFSVVPKVFSRKERRRTKEKLKLNLAKDVKNSKGFSRYVSQERKVKENIPF